MDVRVAAAEDHGVGALADLDLLRVPLRGLHRARGFAERGEKGYGQEEGREGREGIQAGGRAGQGRAMEMTDRTDSNQSAGLVLAFLAACPSRAMPLPGQEG